MQHQTPNRSTILRRSLTLLALALTTLAASARADSLESRLNALLANDQLKNASVGISIVEISPKKIVEIYAHNPTLPLTPASCTKLLTTAAAFETYGPKASFKTPLYKLGDDLLLIGSGDPALGDAKLSAAAGWTLTKPFDDWAQVLKNSGTTSFRDLIIDDRIFESTFVHPEWPDDQSLSWYSAPVGGLNFNVNCLDWLPKLTARGVGIELLPPNSYVSVAIKAAHGSAQKVWLWRPTESNHFEMRGTVKASATAPESVTIHDPGLWTGTILRDRLLAGGLTSTGKVRRITDAEGPGAQLVATYATPLTSVIARANKNSLNMMAEALCKRLGHDATGKPGDWTNGPAAVMAYTKKCGVDPDLVTLDDGSGLSAKNKVAARAFALVLAHVASRPDGDEFVQTLAVPGEDGTLQKRFRQGLPAKAAPGVHGKTGHIEHVSCLSGYLDVNGRRFAFSILCNKYQGNVNPLQDDIVAELWKWASGE